MTEFAVQDVPDAPEPFLDEPDVSLDLIGNYSMKINTAKMLTEKHEKKRKSKKKNNGEDATATATATADGTAKKEPWWEPKTVEPVDLLDDYAVPILTTEKIVKKTKKSKTGDAAVVNNSVSTARIQRPAPPAAAAAAAAAPAARPQMMSNYERAKSLRQLPVAPPPPPSSTVPEPRMVRGTAVQSMRHLKAVPPPPPPPPPSAPSPSAPSSMVAGPPVAAVSLNMARGSQSMRSIRAPPASSSSSKKQMAAPVVPMKLQRGAQSMRSMNAPSSSSTSRQQSLRSLKAKSMSNRSLQAPPPPPPPSTTTTAQQPVIEDMMVAEGVPLTAGKASMPPMQESVSTKKKSKKKEEKIESFDDEYLDDASDSWQEEKLTAEEKAEKREQEVKKSLCWAILSACGLIFVMTLVSKLLQRFQSNDAGGMGEDELLNAAGNALPPPPPGGTTAVNAAVAQNMAVAAGQGAAASTAVGTTTAAAAAAATATATTVTVSAISTTAVIGVSAVTVASVASGVVPIPGFTGAHVPCHEFLDNMKPREGNLVLHMQGMGDFLNFPANEPLLEEAFVKTYNNILGTCVAHSVEGHNDTLITDPLDNFVPTDVYARFMENASLSSWNEWFTYTEDGERIKYYTTEWVAFVGCDDQDGDSNGCSPKEPLFYEDDFDQYGEKAEDEAVKPARRRDLMFSSEAHNRELQKRDPDTLKTNLQLFIESFTVELQELLAAAAQDEDPVEIFYGASLSSQATDVGAREAVESFGQEYDVGTFVVGNGAEGTVDRPDLDTCLASSGGGKPKPIAGTDKKVVRDRARNRTARLSA